MEQSIPTTISASQPALGARLTAPNSQGAAQEFARLGAGLGLSASYGLALGAGSGGIALVQHALGASAGLAAVGVLGMPALFVLLSLVDAPVSPSALLSAGARSLASAGLVLAGLAPSAALLAVTMFASQKVSRELQHSAATETEAALLEGHEAVRGTPLEPLLPRSVVDRLLGELRRATKRYAELVSLRPDSG